MATDDIDGLNGLKDRPRNGRPPEVPEKELSKIRIERSENPSGWKAKEIMNIIHKKADVRYHEVHVYRLLHKWGFKPKVHHQKEICQYGIKGREGTVQKRVEEILLASQKDSQSQF